MFVELCKNNGTPYLRLMQSCRVEDSQGRKVSRKKTVRALISGEEPTYAQIREYCAEETIGDGTSRRRIGF